MEVKAIHRYARSSAQRTRLVADQVRGLPVQKALDLLQFSPRKAAAIIRKVLLSAIANAEHNQSLDIDDLVVAKIMVDEGPSLKRIMVSLDHTHLFGMHLLQISLLTSRATLQFVSI